MDELCSSSGSAAHGGAPSSLYFPSVCANDKACALSLNTWIARSSLHSLDRASVQAAAPHIRRFLSISLQQRVTDREEAGLPPKRECAHDPSSIEAARNDLRILPAPPSRCTLQGWPSRRHTGLQPPRPWQQGEGRADRQPAGTLQGETACERGEGRGGGVQWDWMKRHQPFSFTAGNP